MMDTKYLLFISISMFGLLFLASCAPTGETEGDDQALAGEASLSLTQRAARAAERLSDEELASLHTTLRKNKDPITTSDKIKTVGKALKRVPAEQRLTIVDAEITKRITRTVTPCTSTKDCPFPFSQVCGRGEGGSKVCELPLQVTGSRCERDEECGEGSDCSEEAWTSAYGTCRRCSESPSCATNYDVTATDCTTWGSIESCYVCTIKEEIKSKAICAEGWDSTAMRHSLISNAFNCYSNCRDCDFFGFLGPGEERDPDCVSECPLPTSLEQPCPDGFTFYDWSANGYPYGFAYACLLPGTTIGLPVCNQCGAVFLTDVGDGDIFCGRRP